jgi:D-lyxose ketol-isomerase
MITRDTYTKAREKALRIAAKAALALSGEEVKTMDVADFGLSNLDVEGAEIVSLFDTSQLCARLIVLFAGQTEPEHNHIPIGDHPGKQEVVRVVYGTMYFYLPGDDTMRHGSIPEGKDAYYTCRNEIVMKPGDQLVLEPGTPHWFQAGPDGAAMYSFSTPARDNLDTFTDPSIVRQTVVGD